MKTQPWVGKLIKKKPGETLNFLEILDGPFNEKGNDPWKFSPLTSHWMSDEDDGPLSNAAPLQLGQDVLAPVNQARLEALSRTGVAPLAHRGVEVDADHSNAVPHHAVGFQPIPGPAVAVVVGAGTKNNNLLTKLFCSTTFPLASTRWFMP